MAKSNNNLKAVLQDTADAIKAKAGTSEPITPRDFADQITNIPSGSEYDYTKEFIEGTEITGPVINDAASVIKFYCFSNVSGITEASLANCKYIDGYAFYNCTNLSAVNFPECRVIFNNAFASCRKLNYLSFPKCEILSMGAFNSCSFKNDLNFPECIAIKSTAFKSATISNINLSFPKAIYLGSSNYLNGNIYIDNLMIIGGSSAFSRDAIIDPSCSLPNFYGYFSIGGADGLTYFLRTLNNGSNLSLSKCLFHVETTLFSPYAFSSQANFVNISVPYATNIPSYGFSAYSMTRSTNIYLPNLYNIGSGAFYFTSGQVPSVLSLFTCSCILGGTNVFGSKNPPDSIYVPASRVEYYRTSTNWASLSNYIQPLDSSFDSKYFYGYEFDSNSEITEIPSDRRNVEMVCVYAFRNCINLSEVSLPNCEGVAPAAFYNCSALTNADLLQASVVGSNAFANCINLSTINIPNCEIVGTWAFSNCTALTSINLPKCNAIGMSAFYKCSNLSTVVFGKNCILDAFVFDSTCSKLKTIYFMEGFVIGATSSPFSNQINLKSMYILGSKHATLEGYTGAFSTYTSTFYVPNSMVYYYRSALFSSNSYYYSRVIGLTDQEIEDIKNSL